MVLRRVCHGVMTVWLFEDAFPVCWRRPALGTHHERADVRDADLQCGDQQIAHQMDGLYDAIPDGLRTQGLETKPEVLE